MVGFQVTRKPNGLRIFQGEKEVTLTQDECAKLAKLILCAQREYWRW